MVWSILSILKNNLFLRSVQSKAVSVTKSIDKLGKMTKELKSALRAAQNMKEIEFLVSIFCLTYFVLNPTLFDY